MKNLKEQVQKLSDYKQILESSLAELAREKAAITYDQQKTIGKVSTLEEQLLSLKQQIFVCQEDLDKTKKKNIQLKDQLEEYVMLQQTAQNGTSLVNNSLFNELEMSLSEADTNIHFMNNIAPVKSPPDDDDEPEIIMSTPKATREQSSADYEQLKAELIIIYKKVKKLQQQLSDNQQLDTEDEEIDTQNIDAAVVTKMVDQVIALIRERVLSLGSIDARSNSPSHLDIENCDSLSHISDSEVDILEQKVHDLNHRLSLATSALESTKRDLTKFQALANEHEEKSLNLSVTINSQEREIDALRKERDIMMQNTTVEEKLKKALEERDLALKRENEIRCKYETAQNDMQKLNNQLIAAIQQKLELSEQLEQWQFDMASLIDQQLATKIKKEQQHSRKRGNSSGTNPARMFAAKFFASRNSSRDTSRTGTPIAKSPVPPRT